MKQFSATIAELAALGAAAPSQAAEVDRLSDLESFGSNPGQLRARIHVPEDLADKPALVVVLHGCTQSAAAYDYGSGWSRLADEQGFVLLFPEQRRTNNPNLCFNWFSPADNERDRGEALSIRQMIAATVDQYGIDPSRLFITGLSAGGAMTSIMLAAYPELFAGGAIIAGLPYGSAFNIAQALEAMRGAGRHDGARLGNVVRQAAGHEGPWPTISIWHGTGDATVHPANADAIANQWLSVHGLANDPSETDIVDGFPRRCWRDAAGQVMVEDYRITGMGHGTPLKVRGSDAYGVAGPHMLDAGISSTHRIAAFWDLPADMSETSAPEILEAHSPEVAESDETPEVQEGDTTGQFECILDEMPLKSRPGKNGIQKIIEKALRAAGLMR